MPRTATQFDPHRRDLMPYGFTCVEWRSGTMSRADRHNEVELNLLTTGKLIYLIGGRREIVVPGRLAVFWAAIPHQVIECSQYNPYYVATVPLAWFLEWKLPQAFIQRVLAGEVIHAQDDAHTESDRMLFAQWVADMSQGHPETLRAAALEIEARLLRLALSYNTPHSRRLEAPFHNHHGAALSKIEQMAAWIAQHYTQRVRLADLAAAVGLHPTYAASLYRRAFGVTVNASLNAHRIAHAQRLLAVSDCKILHVALASGFGSLCRFNTTFRRFCGCTPREFRAAHRLRL